MFEKKHGKRFLASVMALVMLLSLAPLGTLAADDAEETQTNTAVTQPANEADQKPVVTDETTTVNTNEETTPPPANEGIAVLPANNNNTPVALPETPVIVKPAEVLDQAFGVDSDTSKDNGIAEYWGGHGNGGNQGYVEDSSKDTGTWKQVCNNIFVAIYDDTGSWPNEPTVSDKGYAFIKLKNGVPTYDAQSATQAFWNNSKEAYINKTEFFKNLEQKTKGTGNDFTYVGGYADNNGITGDADFWATGAYEKFDSLKEGIIRAYFSHKNLNDNISDYDLLIYTVKYEEYYVDGKLYNQGHAGFHIDCTIVPKAQKKVTYDRNLPDGAELADGVTMPDNSTVNKDASISISDLVYDNNNSKGKEASAGNTTYKFLGWATDKNATTATYQPGQPFEVTEDTTFYAVWEDTSKPASKTLEAHYFVLMPSQGTPASGANQGYQNYYPNNDNDGNGDNGGVSGRTYETGYEGTISASVITEKPSANTVDGYFNAKGVEKKYLTSQVDLGYFDSKNYNEDGTYKNTQTFPLPPALGQGFTMKTKKIVWYVIKNVGTADSPDYHVDGYLTGVPVVLRYHDNFNFTGSNNTADIIANMTNTELLSGEEATISGNDQTSHPGYTFKGWTTNRAGTGTLYKAGDSMVMMNSCDLYAQWEQNYTVIFNANGGAWGDNAPINGYTLDNDRTQATSGTLFASSRVSSMLPPTNGQKNFLGWAASSNSSDLLDLTNPTVAELKEWAHTEDTTITLYAIWNNNPVQYTYIIRQHFWDSPTSTDNGTNISTENGRESQGTLIAQLITEKEKNTKWGEFEYIYDGTKTTVTPAGDALSENDTVIDLYYYRDSWKDGGDDGSDSKVDGDGIPDYKQILIEYKYFPNAIFGTVTREFEVATLNDAETALETKLFGSTAQAGTNFDFVKWVSGEVNSSSVAEITNDQVSEQKVFVPNIASPTGGATYTYTAVFNYKPKYNYTVKQHLMGKDGHEEGDATTIGYGTSVKGTLLSGLFAAESSKTIGDKNYVYVSSETTVTVGNGEPKTLNETDKLTSNDTVIDLYYYLDEAGKTGEDKDGEPTDEKDGIPDAWQYKVTFKVVYGKWNDSNDNKDIVVYVNAKDKDGNVLDSKLTAEQIPAVGNNPNSGYKASGSWNTNPAPTGGQEITADTVFTFTYDDEPSATYTYTINRHLMGADAKLVKDLESKTAKANQGAILNSLIKEYEGNQTDGNGNKYVYVSGETTFKMNGQKVDSNAQLTSEATIDLYYYLDNWKDAEETTDSTDKDSATGGDGIPDCYQVLVNYKSGDTNRGSVGTLTTEVLTIKDKEKNVYLSEGQVTASGSTATATGSRCYFSNWTNDAKVDTSKEPATLGQQVINAEGGKTYTFTANFGRSGGSSRPSTPTIDIPDDDVPTGLNGADHYAYIIGYGNNDVRPQNNITRAEVATIFFRLLTDDTREANMTKNQNYSDVKDSNWFCRPVATLSAMNIIKGYTDGSFQPNGNITRAEFAAIAARFDPDGDTTPATFTDVAGHWAEKEISIAANHGWINGYEDGSFRPNQYITRAEAMTLINRVLNRLPETKDDLHADMKTWVDNMDETAWYYLAVQEATNSHYNENKEGTKFEKWTDMREARDWSELEK